MSETILKIKLNELAAIRFTIEDVSSEMPLDLPILCKFLGEQSACRRLSKGDEQSLVNLVTELVRTKALPHVGVAFVLPASN